MLLHLQLDARGDVARRARDLDSAGADGLFTFEGAHDVFFPLVQAAGAVGSRLFTNVAVAFPRSPLHLAHAAYDLHRLSHGRFRLGLGSQVRSHIEKRYGATWSRPAARMREIVLATRAILTAWQNGTPLRFEGEFTRHTLMAPPYRPGPNPYGVPPILLGALGPLMTRTAAEVADGLLVMPFHSERHFHERTLPAVAAGLDRAGRTFAEFALVPQVIAAVGRTPRELAAAADGARRLLAFYGSTPAYRSVLEVEGWDAVQPRLNVLAKQGATDAMADLVDDTMLRTLAVYGTPEQCATEVVRRFGAHAGEVCVYFPGYDVAPEHVRALAAALHAEPVPPPRLDGVQVAGEQ